MVDIRKTVGDNLRRIRLAKGFSQESLAHEAEISPSFLSQIENGKRSATITMLDVLMKTLKTPITELFVPSPPKPKGLPRGRRS